MKADIRPCLQQGEVGDIMSEFFSTAELTTPRAEAEDSSSPLISSWKHAHGRREHMTSVVWNGRPVREMGCKVKRESCQKDAPSARLTGWRAHMLALVTQAEHEGVASQSEWFHPSSADQRTWIHRKPAWGTLLALIFQMWCWKRKIVAGNGANRHRFSGDLWVPIRPLQRQAPRALYGNHVPGVKLIPTLVSACLSVYIWPNQVHSINMGPVRSLGPDHVYTVSSCDAKAR